MIEELLRDLDHALVLQDGEPAHVSLRIIGSTALFLQTDYRRGTKDSDVLETVDLGADVRSRILHLAGEGSLLHRKHRLYIEFVGSSFPFLAEEPSWRSVGDLNSKLRRLRVQVLDVTDVVIAKLARLHGRDREDIAAMEERGLLTHDLLLERFNSAVARIWHDARADDLPRIVRALHWVERDLLGVPESDIELPPWVEGP